MVFDLASWFWAWLVFSAFLWAPIMHRWHAVGFARAWLILSVIWWLPFTLGNLLRLFVNPHSPGGIPGAQNWAANYTLITRFFLSWAAVGLVLCSFVWDWWTLRH